MLQLTSLKGSTTDGVETRASHITMSDTRGSQRGWAPPGSVPGCSLTIPSWWNPVTSSLVKYMDNARSMSNTLDSFLLPPFLLDFPFYFAPNNLLHYALLYIGGRMENNCFCIKGSGPWFLLHANQKEFQKGCKGFPIASRLTNYFPIATHLTNYFPLRGE